MEQSDHKVEAYGTVTPPPEPPPDPPEDDSDESTEDAD